MLGDTLKVCNKCSDLFMETFAEVGTIENQKMMESSGNSATAFKMNLPMAMAKSTIKPSPVAQ